MSKKICHFFIDCFLLILSLFIFSAVFGNPAFAQNPTPICSDPNNSQNGYCYNYPTYNSDGSLKRCNGNGVNDGLLAGNGICYYEGMTCQPPNDCYTQSIKNICQSRQSASGFFDDCNYLYGGFDPISTYCCYYPSAPTPTPTPEPCITYSTHPGSTPAYQDTCAGTNGFYTDKCSNDKTQTITYSCNSSGACQSFTSTCSPGETCVEEPANGLTHCVLVPTPPPGVVAQEEQCNNSGTAWVAVTNVCVVSSA